MDYLPRCLGARCTRFCLPAPLIILVCSITILECSCGDKKVVDPPLAQDHSPPATTTDLAIDSLSRGSIWMTWTAPGDDSVTGQATTYDIRYSTTELDASTWDFGISCNDSKRPSAPGSTESYYVTGLEPMRTYYVALRTSDESHNWSDVSNVVSAETHDSVTVTWERKYGGDGMEWPNVALTTSDGYMIAGYTTSYGKGNGDFWLVHVDFNGEMIWQKTYGTGQDEEARSMIAVSDGYVLAGESGFMEQLSYLWAYVVKTDLSGNEIWSTRWLGWGSTLPRAVVQSVTSDGYVVVGATTYDEPSGPMRSSDFIISIDANGHITDSLLLDDFERLEHFSGRALVAVSDGYLIGGTLAWDPCIVKLSADFSEAIVKPIAIDGMLFSMSSAPDGGAIAVGCTANYSDASDLLLMKISDSGDMEWSNAYRYGDPGIRDVGFSVASCSDGGYLAAGATVNGRWGDLYFVKVKSTGEKEWDRRYGTVPDSELGLAPTPSPDGGYLIAGSFWLDGWGFGDLYLLKTNAYGEL